MNKRNKLSELYDKLYDVADIIIEEYNPCNIDKEEGTCLKGDFCCQGCDYLSDDGCTIKNLSCKIWLCKSARKNSPEVAKLLKGIGYIVQHYNLLGMRNTKEEQITNALLLKKLKS